MCEDFIENMELQDPLESDWSQYFCHRPPVELGRSANLHSLCSELKSSSERPYCSIRTDAERARVNLCNSRSFAMDARIRLDNLKSGCNSLSPCRTTNGKLYNYNSQKDLWDSEESQDEESALDVVELLDLEDDEQDEECWLYESPSKQVLVEGSESALRWCRHVLDNPSPEMEASRHLLMNRLGQKPRGRFCRHPAAFHHAGNVSMGSSMDETSVSKTHNPSDTTDSNELSISHDSITTSYRLQDITDVHIMARIQEASLRQDYIFTPAAASHRSSPVMFPSYPSTTVDDKYSSHCQSPTSAASQSCRGPRLTRLHQQVTQFKLLRLAQNQATSPGRTRSPLRTSLRSLQAVRNSRSLEIDDWHPADQITSPSPGASSVTMGPSGCWSPSLPASPTNSSGSLCSGVRDSARTAAVKRLQRSQSVSPCRIPHPAKGYLSAHGRVFASPERLTTAAWARYEPSTQRGHQ